MYFVHRFKTHFRHAMLPLGNIPFSYHLFYILTPGMNLEYKDSIANIGMHVDLISVYVAMKCQA
jgi:hypothetical protein